MVLASLNLEPLFLTYRFRVVCLITFSTIFYLLNDVKQFFFRPNRKKNGERSLRRTPARSPEIAFFAIFCHFWSSTVVTPLASTKHFSPPSSTRRGRKTRWVQIFFSDRVLRVIPVDRIISQRVPRGAAVRLAGIRRGTRALPVKLNGNHRVLRELPGDWTET